MLNARQKVVVSLIHSTLKKLDELWLFEACVVNAYAESLLDPFAEGDGGKSIGIYQLHEDYLGKGMTKQQRSDVALATTRIVEAVRGPQGKDLMFLHKNGAPIDTLVAEFAHSIERCAACGHNAGSSELERRKALTYKLFPLPAITVQED